MELVMSSAVKMTRAQPLLLLLLALITSASASSASVSSLLLLRSSTTTTNDAQQSRIDALAVGSTTQLSNAEFPPQAQQQQHQSHETHSLTSFGMAFESTPLDIGYSLPHKKRFWTVYWFFNFTTFFLCSALMLVVYRNPKRSPPDVLVASLCFALNFLAVSCGGQCLLNTIFSYFVNSMPGCYLEALFHMISFDAIMGNLALISFDSRRTVQTGKGIGIKRILQLEAAIWIASPITMGVFAIGSPIYMTPSGLFCFFSWTSPLMYARFLPLFIATTVTLALNYYVIFRITSKTISALKRASTSVASVAMDRKVDQMRLAQKLFGFVLLFFIGFGVFVSGVLVAVILGPDSMFDLDAFGGAFIVIHGSVVPITYGLINPRIRTPYLKVLTLGIYKGSDTEEPRATAAVVGVERESTKDSIEMDLSANTTDGKTQHAKHNRASSHGIALTLGGMYPGRHGRASSVGHSPLPMPIARTKFELSHISGCGSSQKSQQHHQPSQTQRMCQRHDSSANHAIGMEVMVTGPDDMPPQSPLEHDSIRVTPPITPSEVHEHQPALLEYPATHVPEEVGFPDIIVTVESVPTPPTLLPPQ